MFRILRAWTQLLQIWWTQDRIRVARNEGKLFRIQVGDRLLIDDKIFKVTSRTESGSSVAQVEYGLEDEQADSIDAWKLSFQMRRVSASLSSKRESCEVYCDQVDVLERTTSS